MLVEKTQFHEYDVIAKLIHNRNLPFAYKGTHTEIDHSNVFSFDILMDPSNSVSLENTQCAYFVTNIMEKFTALPQNRKWFIAKLIYGLLYLKCYGQIYSAISKQKMVYC